MSNAGGSILPLCLEPHPVLRVPAAPVERFDRALKRLTDELIETMRAHDGIGIAAPQVGQGIRLFVANPSQRRGRELIVANPVIESARGRADIVEGCLSVPEIWERVRRSAAIRMRGQNLRGEPEVVEAEGLLAIVLQHEFDHLQGRLFIDRLSWLRRQRVQAKLHQATHRTAMVAAAAA